MSDVYQLRENETGLSAEQFATLDDRLPMFMDGATLVRRKCVSPAGTTHPAYISCASYEQYKMAHAWCLGWIRAGGK